MKTEHEKWCAYGIQTGLDEFNEDCNCHSTLEELEDEWVASKLLKRYGSAWMYKQITINDTRVMTNKELA